MKDGTGAPEEPDGRSHLERYGRYRVARPEAGPETDVELHEVHRGTKPGTRYYRLTPVRQQKLRRLAPGYVQATEAALRPTSLAERAWRAFKRLLVGTPLATSQLVHERLDKVRALAVFSSDAISSSAYATEEILIVLSLAGTAYLGLALPIAAVIGAMLLIVSFSYRQTIRAYPNGGGSYIVAHENLGVLPGLTAAAALLADYVMTVAVSIAAGVAALTSAAPGLYGERVIIAVAFVAFITVANLRGVRESGTIFAIPTYAFIVAFGAMIVGGFIRLALGSWGAAPSADYHPEAVQGLGLLLILRAFASGSAAVTGIEAMSNGIPAFKPPESKNAATTLAWMAGILLSFFIGLTILAHFFHIVPLTDQTVPSQVAQVVFGKSFMYYIVQGTTMLILVLAANTSFADFPRLASILAKDSFMPKQFALRGDRLNFSNGIMLLGAVATGLLILYGANTNKLIPLYAVGVFLAFTLSQTGMVIHWWRLREAGWKRSIVINGVGAIMTAVVTVVVLSAKLLEGAWIIALAVPVLILFFWSVGRHYRGVREQMTIDTAIPLGLHASISDHRQQQVIVPVDEINRAVVRTLGYARAISHNITAIHVTDDPEQAERLRSDWESQFPDTPMVIVESPFRSLVAPLLAYVDALDQRHPGSLITVVLPEFIPAHFWQGWLHNQSAQRLKRALMARPNTVVIDVPYHLKR